MSERMRDAILTVQKVTASVVAIAEYDRSPDRLRIRMTHLHESLSRLQLIADDEARQREQGQF